MEIIIYEGSVPLHKGALQTWQSVMARRYGGCADITVHRCCSMDGLTQALNEAAGRELGQGHRYFPFRSTEGIRFLKLENVCYFFSRGHQVLAKLIDDSEIVSRTMRISTAERLDPLLQNGQFLRVSRSYYVNLAHVVRVSGQKVWMDTGDSITISKTFFRSNMKAMSNLEL